MEAYAVYLHFDLLEVVSGRGDQRRLIMSFIRSLAENPHWFYNIISSARRAPRAPGAERDR